MKSKRNQNLQDAISRFASLFECGALQASTDPAALLDEARDELLRLRQNRVVVLVALGPNRIQIPCRTFATREKARAFCQEHFGNPGFEEDPDLPKNVEIFFHPVKEEDEDMAGLFTDWYGGCGTPWGYYISEVDHETPFVVWDLD